MLDVIGKGAAQSWQMDNRGPTMVDDHFDFGFAVDWMRKDLGLVLDEARRNGAQLPVTALVDQFYADVQAAGGNRWDTSSLIRACADQLSALRQGFARRLRRGCRRSSSSRQDLEHPHHLLHAAHAARDLGGARRPRAR